MKLNGINNTTQYENNLECALKLLYRMEECSRVALATELNLTQATITKLVNQLLLCGLVEETTSIETSMGRKPKRIVLKRDRFFILTARINRDYIKANLCDMHGGVLEIRHEAISSNSSPRSVMMKLIDMLRELKQLSSSPILGIGVALPGPLDLRNSRIKMMSGFPGWDDVDIRAVLRESLGLPVFIEQDANCGALAELWCGEHSANNLVYITCDRGVGAGVVIKGNVYHGRHGYAGEFGHMSINIGGPRCECGNRGCLELYSSTWALENEYNKALFARNLESPEESSLDTSQDILKRVRSGEPLACEIYANTVRYLAFGTVSLINMLNPDQVIFADKITEGGPLFLDTVHEIFKLHLMPDLYKDLKVKTSSIQKDPIMLGASVLVYNCTLETELERILIPMADET